MRSMIAGFEIRKIRIAGVPRVLGVGENEGSLPALRIRRLSGMLGLPSLIQGVRLGGETRIRIGMRLLQERVRVTGLEMRFFLRRLLRRTV